MRINDYNGEFDPRKDQDLINDLTQFRYDSHAAHMVYRARLVDCRRQLRRSVRFRVSVLGKQQKL